jgi:hypothetical protein
MRACGKSISSVVIGTWLRHALHFMRLQVNLLTADITPFTGFCWGNEGDTCQFAEWQVRLWELTGGVR